jgi:uncharacterized protein
VSLFVDTSAWYAAADKADGSHERAKVVLSGGEPLVTTDHVLVESWLLLRHRIGSPGAEKFWEGLRAGAASIDPVGTADLEVAWGIGQAFPDQRFSLVDRTSFAVMQRLGMRRVAAFDEDFAIYRFGKNRRDAFEIVR